MKNEIMTLLQSYNATAEAYSEHRVERYEARRSKVWIETGSNEGYYVCVMDDDLVVSCRYHAKDEALTALGVLLTLVPNQ